MSRSRVQQTEPVSMAVLVDGGHELALVPADPGRSRWDLIGERIRPSGDWELLVICGDELGPPATPPGVTPLAKVYVPRGLAAMPNAYIHSLG